MRMRWKVNEKYEEVEIEVSWTDSWLKGYQQMIIDEPNSTTGQKLLSKRQDAHNAKNKAHG